MKLAVSQLAWNEDKNEEMLDLLGRLGVGGIEVVPSKVFHALPQPPRKQIESFRDELASRGLQPVAIQAFLYGRPDLKLFDDAKRDEMLEYTKHMVELAEMLGVPRIVYGAPKSRDKGERPYEECWSIAKSFFRDIGGFSEKHGIVFCLEPNPAEYNCSFITNAKEARKMVLEVASPGFGLNLDAACMYLVTDDPKQSIWENADIIRHFHVSEPNLSDLSNPHDYHGIAAAALKTIDYGDWISIEMLASGDPERSVKTAVEFVKKTYLA